MRFERVEVITRDGYRTAQEPASFEFGGEHHEVAFILDRWYEGSMSPTRLPMRYFKVQTAGGGIYVLRYHEFFAAWSVLVPESEAP